jgi:GntR family transcriptional regulator of arabinose operon
METVYKPKYIQIKDELISRIKAGSLKANSLIPSDRALAEEFSVSRYTAIKAVQELEKEGIVFREQGKGTFVAPPDALEGIKIEKTYKIGLVISDLAYVGLPYMSRVLKGVNEKLSIHSYNLVLFGLTGSQDSKIFSIEEIVEKRQVDGLLVDDNVAAQTIAFLCQERYPFVQFGSDVGKVAGYDYSRVVVNTDAVFQQAVRYLYEKGRRRIAFLQGFVSEQPKTYAGEAFLAALYAVGLKEKKEYLWHGRYGEESGREMAKKLFNSAEPLPDAIVTNEDMIALGVIKEARARGIIIPEDMMVLGTGDYLLDSPLTTFKNHVYEMGGCAAELLIHKLQPMRAAAAEVERVFLPELVVRET